MSVEKYYGVDGIKGFCRAMGSGRLGEVWYGARKKCAIPGTVLLIGKDLSFIVEENYFVKMAFNPEDVLIKCTEEYDVQSGKIIKKCTLFERHNLQKGEVELVFTRPPSKDLFELKLFKAVGAKDVKLTL